MRHVTVAASIPDWVHRALGADATDLRRLPWGFTNETWTGITAEGLRLVATRIADSGSAARILAVGSGVEAALAGADVVTPGPMPDRSDARRGIVVTPYLEGTPGMELLDRPGGPEAVGRALGEAWARFGSIDPAGLGLDDLWARPGDLAAAARGWLRELAPELAAGVSRPLEQAVEGIEAFLVRRPPGFVHGDLVPANVLLRDGRTAALLDLEAVRIGERLLDAAWFRWIVRYHHPGLAGAAWQAFATGAKLDPAAETDALLDVLPGVRILEILGGGEPRASVRAGWLRQLSAWARATSYGQPRV